ncbi:hypothetical protein RIF29_29249 [Crotalaria pallida]|uniref:Uncharacterized protein n=1 Tax=Crotalaria pallida TaxID=3830 RepID=A0AAN9EGJ4_CROPI
MKMKKTYPESSTKPIAPTTNNNNNNNNPPISSLKPNKPSFMPAKDDTKPVLQDPILRSDPIETEEVVLRLPPFSIPSSTSSPQME